jgi:hypothetical protein
MGCLIFINKLLFHFQKKEVKGKKKRLTPHNQWLLPPLVVDQRVAPATLSQSWRHA